MSERTYKKDLDIINIVSCLQNNAHNMQLLHGIYIVLFAEWSVV